MASTVIEGNIRVSGNSGQALTEAVVRLEDISLADAPSLVVAEARYAAPANPSASLPYRLRIPAGAVQDDRQYTLSARAKACVEGRHRVLGTVQTYPWRSDGSSTTDLELHELD